MLSGFLVRVPPVASLYTQPSQYPLPWPQTLKPLSPQSAPLWPRLAGLYLLKQFVAFSRSEFLSGVRDAVHTIASVISDKARHSELEHLVTNRLYNSMRTSLEGLPCDASIHLDIESLRRLQLCTIHGVVGEACHGDLFAVRIFGQKMLLSESQLQSYSEALFRGSREDRKAVEDAMSTLKTEFAVGVSFTTVEKFVVFGGDGKVLEGSNQFRTCHHFWKFSSLVNFEAEEKGEYPLNWTVSDINNYLDSQD